ncbi:MAG TPA: hypothetical protein VLA16_27060, partial [Ideonella sp.]|nr:hypothetical protein [Ideonella sp.]
GRFGRMGRQAHRADRGQASHDGGHAKAAMATVSNKGRRGTGTGDQDRLGSKKSTPIWACSNSTSEIDSYFYSVS